MEGYKITVVGKESDDFVSQGNIGTRLVSRELPIETFQANLTVFIERLGVSLKNIQSGISNYALDEIEINIEVSASGSISLIGSVETGATGGITLKFKRC